MKNVIIGKGKLAGKGVYATKNFHVGELVMSYKLKELDQEEFNELPKSEHIFTHSFWGKIYLYPEPARYVNHSPQPNTKQDLENMCDYAICDIKKGEMITTNAKFEIENEVITFIEVHEKLKSFQILEWQKKGYRNVICIYISRGVRKKLTLKRINGNWHIISESLLNL